MREKGIFFSKSFSIVSVVLISAFIMLFTVVNHAVAQDVQTAVVSTVDPQFQSSAISVISVDKNQGARTAVNFLNEITNSDSIVIANENYFYRLERTANNNVTKYEINTPTTRIWQYSCQGDDVAGANPHDMIFVSSTKAYLLRYGSTKAWIVNPSAATADQFKIGELDLSSYSADLGDGTPDMESGVIVNGKLFITLQRIDTTGGWGNYVWKDSYVAVYNIENDQEIDTGKGGGSMLGILLPAKNPGAIQYILENNRIYIQASGASNPTDEYSGGIISLNPDTYETSLVVDDDTNGNGTALLGGRIYGMAVVNASKAYLVIYEGWGDCTLYPFNPSTGVVSSAVPGTEHLSIAGMSNGIYADQKNMLWVNSGTTDGTTEPEIIILNTATDEIDERIQTLFNPGRTAFCTTTIEEAPPLEEIKEEQEAEENDDSTCFISTVNNLE